MLKRRGRYYYATPGTARREIPLGDDFHVAMGRYQELFEKGPSCAPVPGDIARRLHKAMCANAKARGIEVLITVEDIRDLVSNTGGRCAVTGIRFNADKPLGQRIRPWLPSLDRIDSAGPYALGNVRIVCAATNIAMNQFGEFVFFKMAAALVANRRIADRPEDIGPKS